MRPARHLRPVTRRLAHEPLQPAQHACRQGQPGPRRGEVDPLLRVCAQRNETVYGFRRTERTHSHARRFTPLSIRI